MSQASYSQRLESQTLRYGTVAFPLPLLGLTGAAFGIAIGAPEPATEPRFRVLILCKQFWSQCCRVIYESVLIFRSRVPALPSRSDLARLHADSSASCGV